MTTARTTARRGRAASAGNGRGPAKLNKRLVLNAWMCELFEAPEARTKGAEKLLEQLKRDELEGIAEDGLTHFVKALTTEQAERKELPNDLLLEYDANIVRHWRAITGTPSRSEARLKHFQYLSLLFTEVYLDRYFGNRTELLRSLNTFVDSWNFGLAPGDQSDPFVAEELNKLAFWMATGSGKTLLMHVHLRQYLHYLEKSGRRRELNRIILLTPNEGLSRQHLAEFEESGIEASMFTKEGRSLFAGQAVEIIDIHKLAEEAKEKTVAVESFEGNNLVLVDEGHRGSSASGPSKETGEWMRRRRQLCEGGFSFEYSATFGQAIKPSAKELIQEYGRCILFDYSYRYFHHDGYGKGFRILNLAEERDDEQRRLYLTGGLLEFLQQSLTFAENTQAFAPYLVEKPLWIFVGGTVTKKASTKDISDVADILRFIDGFAMNAGGVSVRDIEAIRGGNPGLLDGGGREIYNNRFSGLFEDRSADDVYRLALRHIFNTGAGGRLHIDELKGTGGEIELRIGDADAFGVVNVGDAPNVVKHCAEKGLETGDGKDFNDSLFRRINEKDSTVNVLIGAKKFSEGWSSWRVSTMGLMNVGRGEGSEIIQLFGRGVRLKGYGFSLKRSGFVTRADGEEHPKTLGTLETLNVFGIRADYMQQFRDFLEEEGLPQDDERILKTVTVINRLAPGGAFEGLKLLMVGVKDGMDYKRNGPPPTLEGKPFDGAHNTPVVLDWYPRIQLNERGTQGGTTDSSAKTSHKLTANHMAFFDWDAVWFELQRFKAERSWHNLGLPRGVPQELMANGTWYELYIPADQVAMTSFERVRVWQEIAVTLLKKYIERFYERMKSLWEAEHLEYRELTPDDNNMVAEWQFRVHPTETDLLSELDAIEKEQAAGTPRRHERGNLRSLAVDQHLYTPLIALDSEANDVRPADAKLNEGERRFIEALQDYWSKHREEFGESELYVLRNRSRGRGLAFLEAGNFYPDFILWLKQAERSNIVFVDPKGLRNLEGLKDPKVQLAQTVKEREAKLGRSDVTLDSFIVSTTPYERVQWAPGAGLSVEDLEDAHVMFPADSMERMLGRMFERVGVRGEKAG